MKKLKLITTSFLLSLSVFLYSSQHRIVSLTPSITETLYILGETETVVGITSFCKRISCSQKIVGTYLEPNIEEIVKLNPTVVFLSKEGVRREVAQRLKNFHINVIVLEPADSYEEIKEQFLTIARFLNKEKVAKKIIKEYDTKFKIYSNRKNKSTKKVICIINLHPLIVASTSSYIGEIIKVSGALNPVVSKVRYPQISIEELMKFNPEIIILPDMGMQKKEIKNFFYRFKGLSAVKNEEIYIVPSEILCQPNIKNFFLSVEKIRKILERE